MEAAHAGLTLAVALATGVLAQSAARHLRIPGIVLLLTFGAALGPDGLGWVHPSLIGQGLFGLVDFAVAIILFEGGLNLEISRLRRQEKPIRRLITWGVMVTLTGATIAAWVLLQWPLDLAFLFGSLVVVTGPTVIAPLVRDMRLRPHLRTVIEAEGVLIDPIGAILAILVLQFVLFPAAETLASELVNLGLRLGFGILTGLAGGYAMGWLLRWPVLVPRGHENILTLALVYLLFQASDLVVSHSGILAVTVAGVVVGNLGTPVDRDLREFKDQLTVMLVGILFILLAADIRWQELLELGRSSIAVIAALVLVVRPVGVFVSTQGSTLSINERLFLAWVAPRGIVAAAIASLTAEAMTQQQISGGDQLRAMVFITIAATVLLAGVSARFMAWALRLQLPRRENVAILGVHELGLAMATSLREGGTSVVFLDADPKRCQQAQDAGFTVVFGDALQERTLLRAQFELVDTVVGLTPNDHLNSLFVAHARQSFKVPKAYVAVDELDGQAPPTHVKQQQAEVLFDGPHEIERWDVRFRHGDGVVEHFVYVPVESPKKDQAPTEEKPQLPRYGEQCVILTITSAKRTTPMRYGYLPKQGDLAAIAIFKPERDKALQQLRATGWALTAKQAALSPNSKQGSA